MSFDLQLSAISTAISSPSVPPSEPLLHKEFIPRPLPVEGEKLHELCQKLKDWLPDFDQLNGVSGVIDPYLLAPSRWSGRYDNACQPECDDELETEPGAGDLSSVPLLIRPWPPGVPLLANFPQAKYEVLSGGRRLLAHLYRDSQADRASSTVSHIAAVLLHLDDQASARLMMQSNRAYKPLRPLESGRMYQRLLDDKVFKNQKCMAEAFRVQESEVCRGLKLARLDPVIVGVLADPLELQYVDGDRLEEAWQRNPAQMTARAHQAFKTYGKLGRAQALAILLSDNEKAAKAATYKSVEKIPAVGPTAFVVSMTAKGVTTMKATKEFTPEASRVFNRFLSALASGKHAALFIPD